MIDLLCPIACGGNGPLVYLCKLVYLCILVEADGYVKNQIGANVN